MPVRGRECRWELYERYARCRRRSGARRRRRSRPPRRAGSLAPRAPDTGTCSAGSGGIAVPGLLGRGRDVGVRRAVALVDLDAHGGAEGGGDLIEDRCQVGAPEASVDGVRLAARRRPTSIAIRADLDVDRAEDDGDPHSPSTVPSRRTPAMPGDSAERWLSASRSRPGGLPSPTFWVSSFSRIPSAVFRTRSAVDWTTSTGRLARDTRGPRRDVGDGVRRGVEAVGRTDHQCDRLGFDFGDAAVQGRVGCHFRATSRSREERAAGRVRVRGRVSSPGRRRPCPSGPRPRGTRKSVSPLAPPIAAADETRRSSKPRVGDLICESVPEPGGCLALQQVRAGEFRDRVAGGLRDVPDVGRLETDRASRSDGLADRRLLAARQATPGGRRPTGSGRRTWR